MYLCYFELFLDNQNFLVNLGEILQGFFVYIEEEKLTFFEELECQTIVFSNRELGVY